MASTDPIFGPAEPGFVDAAIHGRRTHKVYGRDPVPRETLDELFELARWAPNHHLTEPWRFRVLGPSALDGLKAAGSPADAVKLDRAPTLVAASVLQTGTVDQRLEDVCAASAAIYIVLLAAHARGLAGYWRTPAVLASNSGRAALGIGDDEITLGLIHLGPVRQEARPPARRDTSEVVSYLD
ncbi:MAG TPA: nitroreductase family protein [Solirubrobacteraceae bacterium]|jgi:nitroreductase|nr:nitroreductase family protein [Solirubrobacteraceae bacterium]